MVGSDFCRPRNGPCGASTFVPKQAVVCYGVICRVCCSQTDNSAWADGQRRPLAGPVNLATEKAKVFSMIDLEDFGSPSRMG